MYKCRICGKIYDKIEDVIACEQKCLLQTSNKKNEKEEPLNNISKKIPALNNISCKFRQEKQTSNILLKSSGDFVFDKSKFIQRSFGHTVDA